MWANAQLDSRPHGAVLTSAMSSSDRLTRKTDPRTKHRVATIAVIQPKLYRVEFRTFACPTPCPKGTTDLSRGHETPPCLVWTSLPSNRLTLLF